jgi:hypothetical protein
MEEHTVEQVTPFAALIGIDWSDRKHDVCLVDAASGRRELTVVAHTPEALNEWARALRARFGEEKVAVCMEQSRGSLIYALLKYDFLVLYPINPQMLSRFREAFTPSRAKDDPTDAAYLVELLIHHRERLKAWTPSDEKTRTLQLIGGDLSGIRPESATDSPPCSKATFRTYCSGFLTSGRRWCATFCYGGQALAH